LLFNSFGFLAFFAALAVLYYILSQRYRWILLLVASLYFYATFRPAYVLLLAGVTLIAYLTGLAVAASSDPGRRKAIFAAGVTAVLGTLFVFKYYDFFAGAFLPRLNPVIAVGLSFYTFSCVSYLADVYAGRLSAERHFGYFAVYVSFFPKLLAGPIERARPFLAQLREPVPFESAGVTLGLQLMLWGLFKKVVIADRLAPFVDAAYRRPEFSSAADLVLATYFFAFQLYCDFSGYSDIAIGAAKVLGFDLMENFRRPYLSTSVREFWAHRWHLSLASWFRDYLYIPLGGSRVSRIRMYGNVMAVFLISGLWHGANWTFVVWGGLNGMYQVVSLVFGRDQNRKTAVRSFLSGLVTFHLVLITWVFFRAASLSDAATILSRVVRSASSLPRLLAARAVNQDVVFLVALIGVLLIVETLDERRPVWERVRSRPVVVRWSVYYALLFALIVFGAWNLREFVYMQF
jgi:D-alanyl-lipoteichoic acid acyltransferase DltB (MBOAT superfamily)